MPLEDSVCQRTLRKTCSGRSAATTLALSPLVGHVPRCFRRAVWEERWELPVPGEVSPRGMQRAAHVPDFGDGGFCPSAVSVSPCCFPSGAMVLQAGPGVWQLLALALCGRGSLARACESRGVFNSSWQPLPDEQERLQQPWAALALPWARAPARQASVLGGSQPFLQVCRSHQQPVPGNRKPEQIFTLFLRFPF